MLKRKKIFPTIYKIDYWIKYILFLPIVSHKYIEEQQNININIQQQNNNKWAYWHTSIPALACRHRGGTIINLKNQTRCVVLLRVLKLILR